MAMQPTRLLAIALSVFAVVLLFVLIERLTSLTSDTGETAQTEQESVAQAKKSVWGSMQNKFAGWISPPNPHTNKKPADVRNEEEEMRHRQQFHLRNHSDSKLGSYSLVARIAQQPSLLTRNNHNQQQQQQTKHTTPHTDSHQHPDHAASSSSQGIAKVFGGLLRAATERQKQTAAKTTKRKLYLFDTCSGQVLDSVLNTVASVLNVDSHAIAHLTDPSMQQQQQQQQQAKHAAVLVNHVYSLDDLLWEDYRISAATIGHPIHLRHAQFLRMVQATKDTEQQLSANGFRNWVARQPDNFLVRRFCGVACRHIARGHLNREHLQLALDHLDHFDVVIDQTSLHDGMAVLLNLLDPNTELRFKATNDVSHEQLSLKVLVETEPLHTWDLLFYEHALVRARLALHELALQLRPTWQPECPRPSPCGCGACSMF